MDNKLMKLLYSCSEKYSALCAYITIMNYDCGDFCRRSSGISWKKWFRRELLRSNIFGVRRRFEEECFEIDIYNADRGGQR